MTATFDVGRAARLLLGLLCAVLLTSMGGGAIYAAPVTLPLLWLAGWRSRGWGRGALDAVAALTAAEVGWAFGWTLGGAWEWLVPLAAVVAVGALFPLSQRYASS